MNVIDGLGGRRLGLLCGFVTIALGLAAALLPEMEWAPRASLVGWLLFLAGLAELLFGASRRDLVGRTAIVSGLLTAAAGLVFILRPFAPYFPVANLVMLWLLVRGGWVLGRATLMSTERAFFWLGTSGVVDLVLGLLLASGLPVAMLVVSVFGPTPAIVARFSLVLAASLVVTGAAEVAISMRPSGASRRDGGSPL